MEGLDKIEDPGLQMELEAYKKRYETNFVFLQRHKAAMASFKARQEALTKAVDEMEDTTGEEQPAAGTKEEDEGTKAASAASAMAMDAEDGPEEAKMAAMATRKRETEDQEAAKKARQQEIAEEVQRDTRAGRGAKPTVDIREIRGRSRTPGGKPGEAKGKQKGKGKQHNNNKKKG